MATTISPEPHTMPSSFVCLYFCVPEPVFVPRPYFAFCTRACLCAYLREDWKIEPLNKRRASPDRTAEKFQLRPQQTNPLPLPPPPPPHFRLLLCISPTLIMKAKVIPVPVLNDLPQPAFI